MIELKQTLHTIEILDAYQLSRIYLLDNSHDYNYAELAGLAGKKLKIVNFKQYQFTNKGINELLMLLAIVDELPDNKAILRSAGAIIRNTVF